MAQRLKILNIWVDNITKEEALEKVKTFVEKGNRPHMIFASNPEKNFSVPKDPVLYETFRDADILLPDGIGMVLAARIIYGHKLKRIPGAEFFFDVCELAQKEGYRVFVYGSKEEVNRKATDYLKSKYPELNIVGRSNGYVSEEDMGQLIEKINESKAQILFIALGSPKQEKWLTKYKDQLKYVRVCQGVGGTLDTIGGSVKRAPEFWQRVGLEWFYRLITEPKRIKRQKVLPLFALLVLKEKIKSFIGLGKES